jgi:hypothetical protein
MTNLNDIDVAYLRHCWVCDNTDETLKSYEDYVAFTYIDKLDVESVHQYNRRLGKRLIHDLKEKNITCFFNQKQSLHGSTYLRFSDKGLGQLRIGNHPEKSKYGSKWHLRTDLKENKRVKHKNHFSNIYSINNYGKLLMHIVNYYKKANGTRDRT